MADNGRDYISGDGVINGVWRGALSGARSIGERSACARHGPATACWDVGHACWHSIHKSEVRGRIVTRVGVGKCIGNGCRARETGTDADRLGDDHNGISGYIGSVRICLSLHWATCNGLREIAGCAHRKSGGVRCGLCARHRRCNYEVVARACGYVSSRSNRSKVVGNTVVIGIGIHEHAARDEVPWSHECGHIEGVRAVASIGDCVREIHRAARSYRACIILHKRESSYLLHDRNNRIGGSRSHFVRVIGIGGRSLISDAGSGQWRGGVQRGTRE